MGKRDEFRRCLEEFDVDGVCAIWNQVAPHLPQPENRAEAVISMHMARTGMKSISFKRRAYSHAWLRDHMLPSSLPDELKPKAERIYPRIEDAIGIASRTPPHRQDLGGAIVRAMSDVVMDHYSRNIRDPEIIRPRMLEAREKIRRI